MKLYLNPTCNFSLRPVTLAVEQGLPVYWQNDGYQVIRDEQSNFVITWLNPVTRERYTQPLLHADNHGTDFKLEDFFITMEYPASFPIPKITRTRGCHRVLIRFPKG